MGLDEDRILRGNEFLFLKGLELLRSPLCCCVMGCAIAETFCKERAVGGIGVESIVSECVV